MKQDVVAVFGYNNVRIYDVVKIKKMLDELGFSILLCKEGITPADREVSNICFDIKLHGSKEEVEIVSEKFISWIKEKEIKLIGILPFSDKGVEMGSCVASKLSLISDDFEASFSALNKLTFRELESKYDAPEWYKKPSFAPIKELKELTDFQTKLGGPVFLKPREEGNSRGCVLIKKAQEIKEKFTMLKDYHQQGLIAEEYIKNKQEYSFDGVGEQHWVTEKETTTGTYRAEVQQIVPAPLEKEKYQRLIQGGKIIAEISGSKNGAVHNEIFLLKDINSVVAVEPNRRPAGDRIWDLAAIAFEDFNPFRAWINWSIGKSVNSDQLTLKLKEYAGIRMIFASHNGNIKSIDYDAIEKLREEKSIVEIQLANKPGDPVRIEPRDNSEFIGYIIAKHKDPDTLKSILSTACSAVSSFVTIINPTLDTIPIGTSQKMTLGFINSSSSSSSESALSSINTKDFVI